MVLVLVLVLIPKPKPKPYVHSLSSGPAPFRAPEVLTQDLEKLNLSPENGQADEAVRVFMPVRNR